jgi:hypothetical protein
MEGMPMTERNYLIVSAVIFGLLATAHFVRLIAQFSLQVGNFAVPMWGSLVGLAIGTALSIWAFRLVYRLQGNH